MLGFHLEKTNLKVNGLSTLQDTKTFFSPTIFVNILVFLHIRDEFHSYNFFLNLIA